MAVNYLRAAPWAIAAAAGLFVLNGMLGQVALQADLNHAMHGVLSNVAEAGHLTEQTAEAMAPLATTAKTLETMNGRLRQIGGDLTAINTSLERVIAGQGDLVRHLDSLNASTEGVVTALGDIDQRNRAMLAANGALARQTEGQAAQIQHLWDLTAESIGHLSLLNARLAFLR